MLIKYCLYKHKFYMYVYIHNKYLLLIPSWALAIAHCLPLMPICSVIMDMSPGPAKGHVAIDRQEQGPKNVSLAKAI